MKPLEFEEEFFKAKHYVERQLQNRLKQNLKGKNKFLEELDKALSWGKVQHEAELLQSNLYKIKKGMIKICVNDWTQDHAEVEILLDPTLSPPEEVSKRFQKSKKLKRGVEPLNRQYEKSCKNVEKTTLLLHQLQEIKSVEELQVFCQKNDLPLTKETPRKYPKTVPSLPYREFMTSAGLQIWVGKSAKENDQLTFTYAKGLDYWLHAHGVPGSHVVLHLGAHKEPDEDSLKDAIQAALFYSKAKKSQEGEVCITQCKYVRRFGKKQPGKVQITAHRIVYARIDLNRLKNLKEREKSLNSPQSTQEHTERA